MRSTYHDAITYALAVLFFLSRSRMNAPPREEKGFALVSCLLDKQIQPQQTNCRIIINFQVNKRFGSCSTEMALLRPNKTTSHKMMLKKMPFFCITEKNTDAVFKKISSISGYSLIGCTLMQWKYKFILLHDLGHSTVHDGREFHFVTTDFLFIVMELWFQFSVSDLVYHSTVLTYNSQYLRDIFHWIVLPLLNYKI